MSNLKISISYYDKKHEELFKSYSNIDNISKTIGDSATIVKEEFLTYLLYTEQKNVAGFRNYLELNQKKDKSILLLRDYINFPRDTISSNFAGAHMDKDLTERIGVSISLCIMNKIHNLQEADWEFIPEKSGPHGFPTLDYKIASTGTQYIQVESKGSTHDDNRKKPSKVSNHKSSIEKKKKN